MDELLETWFIREVLSHEPALTRYIARVWPNRADVQDLRQEIYIKLWEAAEKARPLSPRYFLFTVAKNHLTDRARRNRIVPIDLLQDCDVANVLIDEVSPERQAGSFEQLARLVDAFERLPDRCREAVWLRKIEGMPQRKIAERMNIAEGTVEAHLVRGMRLLTRWFYSNESAGVSEAENRNSGHASRREK